MISNVIFTVNGHTLPSNSVKTFEELEALMESTLFELFPFVSEVDHKEYYIILDEDARIGGKPINPFWRAVNPWLPFNDPIFGTFALLAKDEFNRLLGDFNNEEPLEE